MNTTNIIFSINILQFLNTKRIQHELLKSSDFQLFWYGESNDQIISYCSDILNTNIKSFLLLVEWKIIKHKK